MELSLPTKFVPAALLTVIVSLFAMMIMWTPLVHAEDPPANADAAKSDPADNGGGVDAASNLCDGANLSLSGGGDCDPEAASSSVDSIIKTIVNVFTTIVGIVAVIMIIYGGFKYITSGGDSGKITSAKNTIIYALIGLVVVALAQIIVKFVINKSTSA